MALLFIESFETYGNLINVDLQDELNKKWGSASGNSHKIITGRDGGKAIEFQSGESLYYIVTTDKFDWIVGFAFQLESSGASNEIIFRFAKHGGGTHFHLSINGTDLRAHLLGSVTPDTIEASAFTTGVWYYIEVKVHIDDSTGSYDVKINEVSTLSNSSVDTDNGSSGTGVQVRWGSGTAITDIFLDDIYICDNTGAQNNDFLGDSSVVAINPSSDITTEWGSTDTTHYTEIDDNPSDEDITYIETGSPSAVDLFGFENVTSLYGTIYGIQVCGESTRTGDAVDLRIVSGATTSDGTGMDNTVINDPDYVTYTRIVELDPNTSSAWILSNLNAAQFGAILDS